MITYLRNRFPRSGWLWATLVVLVTLAETGWGDGCGGP